MDQDEEHDNLASLDRPQPSPSTSQLKRPPRKAYAGRSGRELSTSAAKRQSVMALGSIKHLQHMYAKNGLASNSPLAIDASGRNLPLALPGHDPSSNNILESPEEDLPPSPSPPPQNMDKSFQVEVPSLRLQKQAVYREMAEVCEKWGLVEMDKFTSSRREASTSSTNPSSAQSSSDPRASMTSSPMPSETQHDNLILTLMNTTTSAIRAAQKYFLALPPEKLPYGHSPYMDQQKRDSAPSSSARGLPSTLGVVTASRPIPRHSTVGVASSSKIIDRSKNITDEAGDPLLRLRKASLATLGTLKEMEARFRLAHDEVPVDQLDDSMQDLSVSSSTSSSAHQPTFQVEDTSASERSGSSDASRGHLYRDDVSLLDLAKEGQIVKNWIETVDSLLSDLESGSKTPRPRTKSGNLESGIGSLPIWARDDRFEHDSLARLAACLAAHLPANLLPNLPRNLPRNDCTSDLLLALSDGQLLCIAYNAVLRASHRPWGFIPESSIHDVISLSRERKRAEEAATGDSKASEDTNHLSVAGSTPMRRTSSEGLSNDGSLTPTVNADGTRRVGLTFRRLENLRLFVGALRLRYLVQMSPNIDLKAIARKNDGWEDMLKEIACAWVNAAAEEKRNEELESD